MVKKVKKKKSVQTLKKVDKKQKRQMRQVSARKMNVLFIGILTGFFLLSTTAIGLNVYGQLTRTNQPKVETVSSETVDYRLQSFLDGYVETYFTYSNDTETQKVLNERLKSYYNYVPTIMNQGQLLQEMSLDSMRLLQVKDNVAVYEVTYETGSGDDVRAVTLNFNIPFGGDNGQYYVSGLPWMTAVESYKAKKVDGKELLMSGQKGNVTGSKETKVTEFMKLFFTNYTTSQKNLNLISDGITTINGAVFKSLDWSYYHENEDGSIDAYVQATFEIMGTTHSENFHFKLSKKKDAYFVDAMSHEIPADYAKNKEEK